MGFFDKAPKPKSPLGYHRVLAPSAGIKVSPLCLGAMNFGTKWYVNFLGVLRSHYPSSSNLILLCRESFMGECKKENAFAIMDTFYDLGGNFIDM